MKYALVEAKVVDVFHFQMVEGKFLDLENKEMRGNDLFVYANISNHETETLKESDVRVYAHSFEDMYCAEDYELNTLDRYAGEFKQQLLESNAYKKFEEGSGN